MPTAKIVAGPHAGTAVTADPLPPEWHAVIFHDALPRHLGGTRMARVVYRLWRSVDGRCFEYRPATEDAADAAR